jgi:phage terminase large subunit GpA-like protein
MKTIPLGSRKYPGHVALVDDDDYEFINQHHWTIHHSGRVFYAVRGVWRHDGVWTNTTMHKFLTGWSQVDHINHDGLDNRRCNLREATKAQNAQNMRSQNGVSSAYKGVNWYKRDQTWEAKIKVDGRVRFLGRFADERDAAAAYNRAALAGFGEFAYLNDIEGETS